MRLELGFVFGVKETKTSDPDQRRLNCRYLFKCLQNLRSTLSSSNLELRSYPKLDPAAFAMMVAKRRSSDESQLFSVALCAGKLHCIDHAELDSR